MLWTYGITDKVACSLVAGSRCTKETLLLWQPLLDHYTCCFPSLGFEEMGQDKVDFSA
jgi:hypothetical protein